MTALRWATSLLGALCLVCLFFAPRGLGSTVVAALFFICFVTVGWTVGAFSREVDR